MYKVYGDMLSGNCYKIKLLMEFLNIKHQWTHVDILESETQADDFVKMNPNQQIPVLEINESVALCESNAILNYLAKGSSFLPDDHLKKAKVLQWQFFEQYSHEPYIATARYINIYLGLPEERKQEFASKQVSGHKALKIMDKHLEGNKYFVGESPTIADISLFAYTHVAHDGGFDLSEYTQILRWIDDFKNIRGYIKMDRNNA